MSAARDSLLAFLIRLAVAAPFFAGGWFLMSRRAGAGTAGFVLLALGMFLTGSVIVGPSLARLLAEPWGSLFSPDSYYAGPLPMYGIPESRRGKGDFEGALEGFAEIAAKYPREVRPYVEMIDIAIRDLRDETRAHEAYEKGMAVLRREEDRTYLTRMYQAIRSRLQPAQRPPPPRISRRR